MTNKHKAGQLLLAGIQAAVQTLELGMKEMKPMSI